MSPENVDPEYVRGLQMTIPAAIDYAVLSIERAGEEEDATPFPGLLLLQARRAARSGISIDTVLRRYIGGYSLFADFVIQEAERNEVDTGDVQELLRQLGRLFDRLLAALAAEYEREMRANVGTAEMRRSERLRRLLDGESMDVKEFSYDFDGYHVGAIAAGADAADAIRMLASELDRRLLLAQRGDGIAWAWLGGRWELHPGEIKSTIDRIWPDGLALALGEPGRGLGGWRLTHRQAGAAFAIAQLEGAGPVYYASVALLASTLQDTLLEASLRTTFLEPLKQDRDAGEAARQTLRAYLSSGRNASSAAARLGVSRRTVTNRLRAIEERLKRPISAVGAEIEVALQLDQLKAKTFEAESENGKLPSL
jgi:hypothetical protein